MLRRTAVNAYTLVPLPGLGCTRALFDKPLETLVDRLKKEGRYVPRIAADHAQKICFESDSVDEAADRVMNLATKRDPIIPIGLGYGGYIAMEVCAKSLVKAPSGVGKGWWGLQGVCLMSTQMNQDWDLPGYRLGDDNSFITGHPAGTSGGIAGRLQVSTKDIRENVDGKAPIAYGKPKTTGFCRSVQRDANQAQFPWTYGSRGVTSGNGMQHGNLRAASNTPEGYAAVRESRFTSKPGGGYHTHTSYHKSNKDGSERDFDTAGSMGGGYRQDLYNERSVWGSMKPANHQKPPPPIHCFPEHLTSKFDAAEMRLGRTGEVASVDQGRHRGGRCNTGLDGLATGGGNRDYRKYSDADIMDAQAGVRSMRADVKGGKLAATVDTLLPKMLSQSSANRLSGTTRNMLMSAGPDAFFNQLSGVLTRRDHEMALRGISGIGEPGRGMPILVCAGSEDQVFPLWRQEQMKRQLSIFDEYKVNGKMQIPRNPNRHQFYVFQGAGHLIPLEEPAKLAEIWYNWLLASQLIPVIKTDS